MKWRVLAISAAIAALTSFPITRHILTEQEWRRAIDALGPAEWTHAQVAGKYSGAGRLRGLALWFGPDGRYMMLGTGWYTGGGSDGRYILAGDRIVLRPRRRNSHLPTVWHAVKWAHRTYMVDRDRIPEFCRWANDYDPDESGEYPDFLCSFGGRSRPPGLPDVPAEFRHLLMVADHDTTPAKSSPLRESHGPSTR